MVIVATDIFRAHLDVYILRSKENDFLTKRTDPLLKKGKMSGLYHNRYANSPGCNCLTVLSPAEE